MIYKNFKFSNYFRKANYLSIIFFLSVTFYRVSTPFLDSRSFGSGFDMRDLSFDSSVDNIVGSQILIDTRLLDYVGFMNKNKTGIAQVMEFNKSMDWLNFYNQKVSYFSAFLDLHEIHTVMITPDRLQCIQMLHQDNIWRKRYEDYAMIVFERI